MKKLATLLGLMATCWAVFARSAGAGEYEQTIRPLLVKYCFDCHFAGDKPEGNLNLERFTNQADALRDRAPWQTVFNKLEAHEMPPPKEPLQPTAVERKQILSWITQLAAEPDPALAARDPGKPVLRRLTRLEYNNTVRDLLDLDTDIFIFPERQPLASKRYFRPATGEMGQQVEVSLREYGAKYPALLPQAGLPGDSRAEHGFRNRGDANSISAAALEQYVELAGTIVQHPDLPQRSPAFAELLGLDPALAALTPAVEPAATRPMNLAAAVGNFAPKNNVHREASDLPVSLSTLREQLPAAYATGQGGIFDVPENFKNHTIAGKGGLIRVPFGEKQLTINPDVDLWLVGFATAQATSGPLLFTNKQKGEKRFELTFRVEAGNDGEGIVRLGVCVLGRSGQQGDVTLQATLSDGTTTSLTATLPAGPDGNTFFSFSAPNRVVIRRLLVDGTAFSGDYVLLDDLAFMTNGKPQDVSPLREPPVDPPMEEPTRPAARQQLFVAASLDQRLAKFVHRAFRRPPTEDELSRFHRLLNQSISRGQSESEALRLVAHAVLASPSFLFVGPSPADKLAADPPGGVRPLDDFELASRLSYFLWSSLPDDELLELAARGMLRDESVLEAQVRRMLRDPKSRELSESFAVQWLRLDQLYTAKPDRDLFPAFYSGPQGKSTLHGAMLVEALLLFETVHVEDRSILDFLAADYTWLNAGLAKLYGLESPYAGHDGEPGGRTAGTARELPAAKAGDTWRRVPLAAGERGGFLTMAAPLTITSLPFRTSPVKRGAWLLETVFNRPPTEPKVAFAIENDTKEEAALTSVRQRFEAHRNQPACYSCHIRLDPPGFALEAFNSIGAKRERDGNSLVDAQGEWQGARFDGPAQFKALLAQQPHEFTRGFIEHLLSYALARRLEIYDLPAVAEIERAATADGYRFSRVVVETVKSYPFRHVRRNANP